MDFRLILTSGDGDEHPGCRLELKLGKWEGDVRLPSVILPERQQVFPAWDMATVARLGRDYYWNYTERAYGVYLFGNHFNVLYGRRTDDSSTEQRWSCFLPFAEWRFVRHTLCNLDGRAVWTQLGSGSYDEMSKQCDRLPKAVFAFKDYDGEELTATTFIEEREWRLGKGPFRWLSLFVHRKIQRSLDLAFSGETGKRKGSWKGGTIGHSINWQDGDSPEWAFRRYCAAHQMEFVKRLPNVPGAIER